MMGFEAFKKKLLILSVLFVLFIFTGNIDKTSAAGASIYSSLPSGQFNGGQVFSTEVVIDGQGTAFNAAKASVVLSKKLSVEDLTLGNCNFAFVVTPTISNPSFTGVILGGSSKKCTVYKLILKGVQSGEAKINLIDASLKAYKNSGEILSSVKGATYTISSVPGMPSRPRENIFEGFQDSSDSYKVNLVVKDENGNVVKGASVILDPQTPDSNDVSFSQVSNELGIAEFSGVDQGVYVVKATYDNKNFPEKVLNINGKNKVISLSIQPEKKSNNIFIMAGLVAFLIVLVLSYLAFKKLKSQ